MFSIDLDGKKIEVIRKNIQSAQFQEVKSIAIVNNTFYWVKDSSIVVEELHPSSKIYFHIEYPDIRYVKKFIFVYGNLPSSQPIPVPVNPPSNLQAIMGVRHAKITWQMPHLLGIQGKGAWQNWSYELEIIDEDYGNKTTLRYIKSLHHGVNDLIPNTNYRFRVAAYTDAGMSPYSLEFRAKTLRTSHHRYLTWSSYDGLLKSDILVDDFVELIPRKSLDNRNITDIAWFDDLLFYVSNEELHFYNLSSKKIVRLDGLDSVQSIAIDWVGRRLYWFNSQKQVVTRGNFNGYEQEFLMTLPAKKIDLKIDAVGGYMYYSTGLIVAYCRLNGKQNTEYYQKQEYSGKVVMGLTLDMDNNRVYWIVRGFDGSSLFHAPMAGTGGSLEWQEHTLLEKNIQGPLAYFSDRLLWLQDDHTVIISNMTGKNLARINNKKLEGLNTLLVVDPTQYVLPPTSGILKVVPDPVNPSSLRVFGIWNNFNISWDSVDNVSYGEVFYEITYLNHPALETNQTTIQISGTTILPYTQVDISIRAYTYWASSKFVKAQIHSPAAAPTEPLNPRAFVNHLHNPVHGGLNIEVVFRWSAPAALNGPLIRYQVNWDYNINGTEYPADYNETVQKNDTEIVLSNLYKNVIYNFSVQAVSSFGMGKPTLPVAIDTAIEKPVPKLLASTTNEVLLVDLDLGTSWTLFNAASPAIHLAYLALDNLTFWVNKNNELISYREGTAFKLHTINSTVISITIDWIERIIYWSQLENNGSSVYAYDLIKAECFLVAMRDGLVFSLKVIPLYRELLWVESETERESEGYVMTYNLDRKTARNFVDSLNNSLSVFRKTIVLDTSVAGEPQIVWFDSKHNLHTIGFVSKHANALEEAFDTSSINLVKDSATLYWTMHDFIFAKDLTNSQEYKMGIANILQIMSFYHQTYPPVHCLIPHKSFTLNHKIQLIESHERSLALRLPKPKAYEHCPVKPPSFKYTILYRPCNLKEGNCNSKDYKKLETYDNDVEITDLIPYTQYQFQLSVSNYYSKRKSMTEIPGTLVYYSTEIGSPSAPRNVTAEPISPTEAFVKWLPPLEFNGESVWYEVHWQAKNAIDGVKNRQQLLVSGKHKMRCTLISVFMDLYIIFILLDVKSSRVDDEWISVNITKLLPKQPYNIWVRAYTTNARFNEGEALEIETLPEPDNITLKYAQSHNLTLNWRPYENATKFVVQYKPITSDKFDLQTLFSSDDYIHATLPSGSILVENLYPKTRYVFTISLYFPKRAEPYVWPQDDRFAFDTLGDVPSAPGKPIVEQVREEVYKVAWQPAIDNGAPIELYALEGLRYRFDSRIRRSTEQTGAEKQLEPAHSTTMAIQNPLSVDEPEPKAHSWTVYYNGTDNYWFIKDLEPLSQYSFRVRAKNSFGWGDYSELSEQMSEQSIIAEHRGYVLLRVVTPAILVSLVLLISIICGK